jgi:hypothetical protein
MESSRQQKNSDTLAVTDDYEWREEIPWERAIRKHFLEKPGEHLIEVGITGSGKTQGLYYLLNGILDHNPSETILWITCGKSSEEMKLLNFMPCNFLFPYRRNLKIETYQETYSWHTTQFATLPELFKHINKGVINILCLAPYYPDPDEYSIIAMELFKALIVLARENKIIIPLAIFIDEFQMFAPARGQALTEKHKLGGIWMQRNIDQLRSIGIRIVAATQSWKRVLQGVRTSFGCIMIRQGAEFPANEIKRLSEGNEKWQGLEKDQMVFTFRNRFYSEPQRLPSYGDGYIVGKITYEDQTGRMKVSDMPIDDLIDSYKKPSKQHFEEETE